MANNISGLPWVIDTAAGTVIKSGLTYVKSLVFNGYSDAAHQCIVTGADGSGNRITVCTFDGQADLGPVSFNEGNPFWLRDIAVTTLGSGRLSVFV
jgi:hypothetical protein